MHLMDNPTVRAEVLSHPLEVQPHIFVCVCGTDIMCITFATAEEIAEVDAREIASGFTPFFAPLRAAAARGECQILEMDASAGRGVAHFRAFYGRAKNRLK